MNIPGRTFEAGETVFSDWFPRGGDNMLLRIERIAYWVETVSSTDHISLTVQVYTKNPDDVGDGNAVDQSGTWELEITDTTSPAYVEKALISGSTGGATPNGLKQLVRLKVIVENTVTSTAEAWMLARIFPPIFFDQATPA